LTKFGTTTWEKVKENVCSNDDYIEESWFVDLKEEDKKSVVLHKSIEIQSRQIDERIDALFPDGNFYFYKIFEGDEQEQLERNMFEQKWLLKLIQDCMSSNRYFIK
jgi:hypothetical protein